MNEHWVYAWVDILVIGFPLLFSFHQKFYFFQEWKFFIIPNLLVAAIFIIWDAVFTHYNIWWFNDFYTLGIRLFNLPLEEILFFISIPYACVFSHFAIHKHISWNIPVMFTKGLYAVLLLFLLVVIVLYPFKYYTSVTFFLLFFTLIYFMIKKDWDFLGKFMLTYFFILPFFFLSNGTLTGGLFLKAPVVFYNSSHILGIRILNIPMEDFFYGMLLLVWNIKGYIFTKENGFQKNIKH